MSNIYVIAATDYVTRKILDKVVYFESYDDAVAVMDKIAALRNYEKKDDGNNHYWYDKYLNCNLEVISIEIKPLGDQTIPSKFVFKE